MVDQHPPLERDLKAALARRLFARGDLTGDAVLINEFNVGDWSRRADLVVANGKLHAYEIKSAADSLERLGGQVETYLRYFDKVTVVAADRHAAKVIDTVPREVEVVAAGRDDAMMVRFKVLRRGRTEKISDRRALVQLLRASELSTVLRENGIRVMGRKARCELEVMAGALSIRELRDTVLSNIKKRHVEVYTLFVDTVDPAAIRPADLKLLSKVRLDRTRARRHVHVDAPERPKINLNLNRIEARWGDLPVDMPTYVRPRVKA